MISSQLVGRRIVGPPAIVFFYADVAVFHENVSKSLCSVPSGILGRCCNVYLPLYLLTMY